MTPALLRARRLRSHRLSAPAATVMQAASHMLAVQSQEFWGGRWALASRARGAPSLRAVDALFDRGRLVRAWTQRGTLHIVQARDLAWLLGVTGERQLRAAAPRYRELGLDAEVLSLVERLLVSALRGGNALTRSELFAVLSGAGIEPGGQRGLHAVQHLALRGILCQGPVVQRADGMSREQRFVLVDEHIAERWTPDDPHAELFVRYLDGHGPATAADYAWWSGLTLGAAREAASRAARRVVEIDEGRYVSAASAPRRASVADDPVRALASFEEYLISYADRSVAGDPDRLAATGPGRNGMVRPILLAEGRIVGTWRASTARGRESEEPSVELFEDVPSEDIAAALARYAAFVAG
ncbi:winged helix DNA-binding domain-containing protein [Microbacterium sp. NPDC055903]